MARRHQRGTSLSFRGATDLSVLKIAPDVGTRVGICHFPAEKQSFDGKYAWRGNKVTIWIITRFIRCNLFWGNSHRIIAANKLIYYSINPSRTNAGYNLRYHTCLKVEYFPVSRLKEITDVFVVTWMKTMVSGIWLNSVELLYQHTRKKTEPGIIVPLKFKYPNCNNFIICAVLGSILNYFNIQVVRLRASIFCVVKLCKLITVCNIFCLQSNTIWLFQFIRI